MEYIPRQDYLAVQRYTVDLPPRCALCRFDVYYPNEARMLDGKYFLIVHRKCPRPDLT